MIIAMSVTCSQCHYGLNVNEPGGTGDLFLTIDDTGKILAEARCKNSAICGANQQVRP